MAKIRDEHAPERDEFLAHAALYAELSDRFRDMRDLCTKAAGAFYTGAIDRSLGKPVSIDGKALGGKAPIPPVIGTTRSSVGPAASASGERKTLRGKARGTPTDSVGAKTLGQTVDGADNMPKSTPMADPTDTKLSADPKAADDLVGLLRTPQGCSHVADLITRGKYRIMRNADKQGSRRRGH